MKLWSILLIILVITFSACNIIPEKLPEAGVSIHLAKSRAERISKLTYDLHLEIPSSKEADIKAKSIIKFGLSNTNEDLFLDFKARNEQVKLLIVNGDTLSGTIINEHIKLPKKSLQQENNVVINFIAGNGALNRNDNYFYALFVPDRARTAIPCFDQPNIKGRFAVKMHLPENWIGVANGQQTITQKLVDKTIVEFDYSQPISTYLWAFAAGEFKYTSSKWKDMNIGLYHMVDDSIKLTHNVETIFSQTTKSLDWLEEYTDYDYPYETYNLVAIPSFQFGGMEHPGATYYRSELIFLDEKPTQNEELSRANLIAHETAHMWFGDLVTMPWFDEVWLKEVFANFMADKITQPWFPEIDHQLRFLLAHFPRAYSVDRTKGANPIGQKLNNLQNAGTLYGSIIYHKSPIVMNQLENMAGNDVVRMGIREYIDSYAFSNASWNDLINCIDKHTEGDLKVWSKAWVNEPGRPVISFAPSIEKNGYWTLTQRAEHANLASPDCYWPQELNTLFGTTNYKYDFFDATIDVNESLDNLDAIFMADDKGYGLIRMTEKQLAYWMNNISGIKNTMLRGRIAINLYENFLDGSIHPNEFMNYLKSNIQKESEPLLVNLYCNQLSTCFWKFMPSHMWQKNSLAIESMLQEKLDTVTNPALKKTIFRSWINIAMSDEALNQLSELCNEDSFIKGMTLNEKDKVDILSQLFIKQHPNCKQDYNKVHKQIKNSNRKAMLEFILPSLSNNAADRDEFWFSLSLVENRAKEKWVEKALANLHHPLRSQQSDLYIPKTLQLLEEIQLTGDIFFPIGWLGNSIGKQSSEKALKDVNTFLNENSTYPEHLKLKILQNADVLERSVRIKKKYFNETTHQ
ncbi:hypothetical protein J1N11_07505 [Marinilabiliaceae bacterium N1Y90]|nr:hypothetical protein [Marinilabiliaceae bacterium N1Y90]